MFTCTQIKFYDDKFQLLSNECLITASYLCPRFNKLPKKYSATKTHYKDLKNIAVKYISNTFKETLLNDSSSQSHTTQTQVNKKTSDFL